MATVENRQKHRVNLDQQTQKERTNENFTAMRVRSEWCRREVTTPRHGDLPHAATRVDVASGNVQNQKS